MRRTLWRGHQLNFVAKEPLLLSLIKYRQDKDRTELECTCYDIQTARSYDKPLHHETDCPTRTANLISSRTSSGRHKPILDMDFPHRYVNSSKTEHAHLYLDIEIPTWRWVLLMCGLRIGGVIESGFFWWSLRRGGNFVRPEGVEKTKDEWIRAEAPPEYGLFRRIRPKSMHDVGVKPWR